MGRNTDNAPVSNTCPMIDWNVAGWLIAPNGLGIGEAAKLKVQKFKLYTNDSRKYKCSI